MLEIRATYLNGEKQVTGMAKKQVTGHASQRHKIVVLAQLFERHYLEVSNGRSQDYWI
jgi:hypothetical protein